MFRISVSVAMASNHANVLGSMLQHLLGVNHAVTALKSNLAGLQPVAIGALRAFAGYEVIRGIWSMVRAGNKLNEELNRTAMLGGEFATRLDEIKSAAFRIHFQVPNVAPSEAVRIMREIAPQMQRPEDAIRMGGPLARMSAVLNYFTGKGHDMGGDDALTDVVRTVEARRRLYKEDPVTGEKSIDLEQFQREATAMERGIILSQGMLKPRDFLLMTRQAGPAGMMQDPTVFYGLMGELSVAMGSQRAGTALTSLFLQYAGGVMPQRVASEMTRRGILQPGEWHPQKGGGGGVVLEPEAAKRLSAMIANPFDYTQKTLVPQLASQGKTGMDLLTEMFLLFGRTTTQRIVSEIAMGGPQWARTLKMFPEVMDPEQGQKFLHQHSLDWSLGELSSSWQGLMEVMSERNVNPFIMVVHGLTDALNWLAQEAIAHPTIAKWLVDASIGVAGLAAVLGTMAVVRFLVISSGLTSITGALTGLADASFTTIAAGLGSIVAVLARLAPLAAFFYAFWPSSTNDGEEEELKKRHAAEGWHGGIPPHPLPGVRPTTPEEAERQRQRERWGGWSQHLPQWLGPRIGAPPINPWNEWLPGLAPGLPGSRIGAPPINPEWLPGLAPGLPAQPGGSALDTAVRHMGQRGADVNGFLHANGQHINAAFTAWCAAFVNAALNAVGIRGSGSPVATSFANWGRAVQLPDLRRGDILLESRGHRPGEPGGHVGFATGRTRYRHGQEEVEMVSGNATGTRAVSTTWEDARGLDVRRGNTMTINLHVDGHRLARVVMDRMGRILSGPATGTTHVDPRAIPEHPGSWG